MYTLLKKSKIYIVIVIGSIIILFLNLDNDFKSKSLISFDEVYYNENEYENFVNNYTKNNSLPIIAHAGGGYNDQIYTNSIDTLNFNKENYDLFELDFFLTDDGKLICGHDWNENFVSFDKFQTYVDNKKDFKPCTYKSLKKWLKLNPKKRIVTDFKNDNLSGLIFIADNFDNFEKVFIPQIYNPKEYKKVKNIGYEDIIWTLYKYNKNNKTIIKYIKKMDLFAVTMPKERAQSELPILLKKNKVKSFVHTINSMKEYFIYLNHFKIDQIYSDWIK